MKVHASSQPRKFPARQAPSKFRCPNIPILRRPSAPYTCPPSRQEAARRPGSVERRHSPPLPVAVAGASAGFSRPFSSRFFLVFHSALSAVCLPFVYGAGQFSRDLCLRRVRGLFATSAPIFSPVLLVSCLPLAYGAPLAVAGFFRQFCLHLACDLPPCRPSRQEAAGAVAGHRAGSGPTRSDQYPRSATRAAAVRPDLPPAGGCHSRRASALPVPSPRLTKPYSGPLTAARRSASRIHSQPPP